MIVVDTNVIVYLFIESDYSDFAHRLYERDHEWCAPLLWRSEFRNVLSFLIKKEKLSLSHAFHIYYSALNAVKGREYHPDPVDVLNLSAESGRTAYDCEFVALAKRLGTRLVTMDGRLIASFAEFTVKLSNFI